MGKLYDRVELDQARDRHQHLAALQATSHCTDDLRSRDHLLARLAKPSGYGNHVLLPVNCGGVSR